LLLQADPARGTQRVIVPKSCITEIFENAGDDSDNEED
jgi:hypothetical protein